MVSISFVRERETKNTVRFSEVLGNGQDRGVIGTLYVLKSKDHELGQPAELTVTIEPVAAAPKAS